MLSRACLIAISLCTIINADVLQNTIDTNYLREILQDGVKVNDIGSLYFSLKGLKLLNANIPNVCEGIKNIEFDTENIEQVFYLTNAAALSGCQNFLKPDILKAASAILDKKDATISELYYSIFSLKALGKGTVYEKEDGLKNLIQLLKKDDSVANYGYAFALCEHIGCELWTSSHAEGVLLAADESDSKALYFEGGLPVTSMLLSNIIRTYKSLKKPTPLTEAQKYKFGEYLLSRRSVTTSRGAALLLEAALALADDEPTPISIMMKGKKYITSDSDSIEILVTDIIGRPIRGLKSEEVIAQSGTRLSDDVVVLSKQPLTQMSNDPSNFVLNLNKIKSQYGVYKIVLSVRGKSANLNIAVLGKIKVETIEVGIGDVDGTTSPKTTTLTYPKTFNPTEKITADHMQKLSLKFTVRDEQGKPMTVQQAFIHIGSTTSNDEAIFVAEQDNTKAYKVELNVDNLAKHLSHSSGVYKVSLFVGDSAGSNPVLWTLGDIHFKFGRDANALGEVVTSPKKHHRGPLPEIRHMFRTPEPRPPRVLSDVFAVCCGAPLLLLLVLWAKLGINLSYFRFSLPAIVFHLALAGSLSLYVLFWLKLTMFETVRYLLPLAVLTFISGHRLLRRLVTEKKVKH